MTQKELIGKRFENDSSEKKQYKEKDYCFLNCRPIDLPKRMKNVVIDVYRTMLSHAQVTIIWNILVQERNYDINVAPDKREVFIKNEADILEPLRTKMFDFFGVVPKVAI